MVCGLFNILTNTFHRSGKALHVDRSSMSIGQAILTTEAGRSPVAFASDTAVAPPRGLAL